MAAVAAVTAVATLAAMATVATVATDRPRKNTWSSHYNRRKQKKMVVDDVDADALFKQGLEGFSVPHVRDFIARVDFFMGPLGPEAVPKDERLFRWFWKKFRTWNKLWKTVDQINDAPEGHEYRTFDHVYNCLLYTSDAADD